MKPFVAVILALALFVLSGCARLSADELLVAPSLTADQSAILGAVEALSPELTTLKYPTSGSERAPIQFVDFDEDGDSEAVVFFTVHSEGVYARMAVLEKIGDGWVVNSVAEGAGTDIESLSFVRMDGGELFMLVEWSSVSMSEHRVAIYSYTESGLGVGFEQSCSDILFLDFDGDGFMEFCYLSQQQGGGYTINYVDGQNGIFSVVGGSLLNEEMLDSLNFMAGLLSDGGLAVFVDEDLGAERCTTEVFTLVDGVFRSADYGYDYTIETLALRTGTNRISRQLKGTAGPVCIPTDTPPYEELADVSAWTYWYTVGEGMVQHMATLYMNDAYCFGLALPEEWLSYASVRASESESRRFEAYSTLDGSLLLELQILAVGEESSPYVEQGFKSLVTSGAYRYYYRGDISLDQLRYLKYHFVIY